MLLDRREDHRVGAQEEGPGRGDIHAPMALFLAWARARGQGVELDDVLTEASVTASESLESGDLPDDVREFAEAFYGRAYFELVRAVFKMAYPVLAELEPQKLAQLGKRLDRARSTFVPDPDHLSPARAITAIREACDAVSTRGFAWDANRAAFVRRVGANGTIVLALAPWAQPAEKRRGDTGVQIGGVAEIRDERVERIVARIRADITTASLAFPLLLRRTRSVSVAHVGRLADAAGGVASELTELATWLEAYTDERTILDAFPVGSGRPAWPYGGAEWAHVRGLFAVASGLETVEQASQVFAELGRRDGYWRTLGARRRWATCVTALAAAAAPVETAAADPRPYSAKARYAIGDRIGHPTFGVGTVILVSDSTMKVEFGETTKTLACGR